MSRPALTKPQRVQLEAAAAVLQAAGLAWRVAWGRHPQIKVTAPDGGVHTLTMAGSPRSVEAAADACRRDARHLVRRLELRS